MTVQSVLAIGFIALTLFLIAKTLKARSPFGLIVAGRGCLVVLGGGLALWVAPEWAGWLTVILFALLFVWPAIFASRAMNAAERGQYEHAFRLLKWGAIFRDSKFRFEMELLKIAQACNRGETTDALAKIEAINSQTLKNSASLFLSFQQRDWVGALSYAANDGSSNHTPIEIRACGELFHLEEMIQKYKENDTFPRKNTAGTRLFVMAFTGHIEPVKVLLEGPLRKIDVEDKSYWTAVASLRRNPNDEVARATLIRLKDTDILRWRRLAAASHLQILDDNKASPPPLSLDSQNVISDIIQKVLSSQRRNTRRRLRWKATLWAMVWLILFSIVVAILESVGWL